MKCFVCHLLFLTMYKHPTKTFIQLSVEETHAMPRYLSTQYVLQHVTRQ